MAVESSIAMRRFFGETERFEVGSGAKSDESRGAMVVMMSPYVGWSREGLVAAAILSKMLVLVLWAEEGGHRPSGRWAEKRSRGL